jgi:hypothetical protein
MSSAGVVVGSVCAVLACLAAVPRVLGTIVYGDANEGLLQIPSNGSLAGCPTHCGDVKLSYPFEIGPGCFRQGFELTCDQTARPPSRSF